MPRGKVGLTMPDRIFTIGGGATVWVTVTCPLCRRRSTLMLNAAGVDRWQNGTLIQEALPELTSTERELLISGVCAGCWVKQFGGEDA